ncbi:MAG: glycosyltransferase [Bacteroidia bacterium]|nr:glycosyltransferase [Bacteroidia bacterium]MCX7652906.1 glycosyltransferase [Bacteroidia bacterium]MDW8416626.1 glycosyltransferase [Bacteroidia bacterium]
MSQVAIVIPTYNNLSELRLCIAALAQQTYRDFTAYICVDGSTDETWAYLEEIQLPFIHPLHHPDGKNRGRNAARNLVLPYLGRHQWLAFLDSDSLPLPDWLESFLKAQPASDEVLLGQILYFSHDNPNPWTEYLQWREEKRGQKALRSAHFITINAFLPAQVFRDLSGMDENMRRHGLGDVEMGYRLKAAGMRFRYIPEAKVWSCVQQTLPIALTRLYDMGQHNLPYLHRKHPPLREELFGGKWLYEPWRRFLLSFFLIPAVSRWLLRKTESLPLFLRRWSVRYLVMYAVARGFWRKKLSLPTSKRERPRP